MQRQHPSRSPGRYEQLCRVVSLDLDCAHGSGVVDEVEDDGDKDDEGDDDDGDDDGDVPQPDSNPPAGAVPGAQVHGRGGRGWTAEEVNALRAGVCRHGEGNWAAIRNDAYLGLSSRSGVNLKDKWRNLTRGGQDPYGRGGSSSGSGPSGLPTIEDLD